MWECLCMHWNRTEEERTGPFQDIRAEWLENKTSFEQLEKHVVGPQWPTIVGPANQNGCIILCVGNLVDEKF
jgi:hypothetical protein